MYRYLKIPLVAVGVLCWLAIFFYQSALTAHAAPPYDLSGYAWSSTIGWISMSCENTNTCGVSDYGLTIDGSRNLNGYAWSSNIGWIKFGGLSIFPSGGGTSAKNAEVVDDGTGGYRLEGWARACAGTVPGDCTDMTNHPSNWDGWISLSGTAYHVGFDSAGNASAPNTFAWGSSVVGWVDFSGVTMVAPPELTFTASQSDVSVNGTVDLNWDIKGFASCVASNDQGATDWDGTTLTAPDATDGLHSKQVTVAADTVYRIECTNASGHTMSDTVPVTVAPDIDIVSFGLDPLPAPSLGGEYNGVTLSAAVDASRLLVDVSVPYTVTLDTHPTLSGTAAIDAATGAVTFNPPLLYNNVFSGTYTSSLELDLPGAGSVAEDLSSTVADEDQVGNRVAPSVTVAVPPPSTLSLTVDNELIRSGETTTVEWDVSALVPLDCEVRGPGIAQSFTTSLSGDAYTETDQAVTANLESAAIYQLSCVHVSTGTTFTDTDRVDVVPEIEEI